MTKQSFRIGNEHRAMSDAEYIMMREAVESGVVSEYAVEPVAASVPAQDPARDIYAETARRREEIQAAIAGMHDTYV